ncbi:N-terminal domain of NEFA-interacting nuclear protein NIP30-domain-containing protein [Phaeosphaeria sp. MPI-PUGE-AT-0046c]|nr:N-terminal domain of NEFA-interacting nuclear protein NIP30-domain-containing protein [Phaeosphaeria sp. MPI-PUGE-AT-0046c]
MSSGFVSGGTVDNPTERDDEWRQAQAELEAARKAKADLAAQHDGKSLYEILQENKDKKQAEFEEKARYHLHVGLDDDEADYLASIREKKRKEEAGVRKDTQEQLEAFRRQQEEDASKALEAEGGVSPSEEQVQWAAPGRKRKKGPESSLLKGVKLRKANSTPEKNKTSSKPHLQENESVEKTLKTPAATANQSIAAKAVPSIATTQKPQLTSTPATAVNALSLGLGYASSDEDD